MLIDIRGGNRHPIHSMPASLSVAAALAAWVLVLLLVLVKAAEAHSWFTDARDPVTGLGCCNGVDCTDIPDTDVRQVEGGYIYLPTGEFIPRERVQPGQGWSYARCEFMSDATDPSGTKHKKGDTRCFFEPSGF